MDDRKLHEQEIEKENMKNKSWIGVGKGGYYVEHPETKELLPIYEFESFNQKGR